MEEKISFSAKDKLNQEYECFFLDMMRTSRENIYSHSHEIEQKKLILRELRILLDNMVPEKEAVLFAQENLLNAAYCFVSEHEEEGDNVSALTRIWFEDITSLL